MNAVFDFTQISTITDFYKLAKEKMALPDYFGDNLDALWDCVTGQIELPSSVEFRNMSLTQLEKFENLISLFEDAQDELGENFTFDYFVRNDYQNPDKV